MKCNVEDYINNITDWGDMTEYEKKAFIYALWDFIEICIENPEAIEPTKQDE